MYSVALSEKPRLSPGMGHRGKYFDIRRGEIKEGWRKQRIWSFMNSSFLGIFGR
jgi:hypothetical protein